MFRFLCVTTWILCFSLVGCGTTRWTDTARTSTEQLLISDAIDRAVSQIDVSGLAGQKVFLESKYLDGTVDKNYSVSVLRQHLVASGSRLMDKKENADYIVEARAGAIGTTRNDVLYGVPSTELSALPNVPGVPSRIPEIPFAKKTEQQGAAKIALFAYHRESGLPYWQSGNAQVASTAKDIWLLGVGPFERGTIREKTKFSGDDIALKNWSSLARSKRTTKQERVWVAEALQFNSPTSIAQHERMTEQRRLAQLPPKPGTTPPVPKASGPPNPPPAPNLAPVPTPAPSGTIRGAYVPRL